MKRVSIFILIILIILIIPSVFAVGINTGDQAVKVFENHTHTFDFCVYNEYFNDYPEREGPTVSLDLEAPGEFIESFNFQKNNVIIEGDFVVEGMYDCMVLTFNSTDFKTINESLIEGGIVVFQAAADGEIANMKITGRLNFELSEISYKHHVFRNFGKFLIVLLSIFLVGIGLISILFRKKEHK